MAIIYLYLLFCLVTALTTVITHLIPILRVLDERGIENHITDSKQVVMLTYFVLSFIIAPLIFVILVVPSYNHRFYNGFLEQLAEEN